MSYIYGPRTGGAHIIPSRRPSIHCHPGCIFQSPNMNRYGLLENEESDSDNEQTVDETDGNVISKPMILNASPFNQSTYAENTNIIRRNSYHLDKKQLAEDDEENDMLSRSVPAKLPSQLYSSNISEDEQPLRNEHQISGQLSNLSFHSIGTPNRSSNKKHSIHASTPQQASTREDATPTQISSVVITAFSVIGVLLTVCVKMLNMSNTSNTSITPSESLYDEFNFYTDISGLGEKYNVDEDSILQVQTGISTIYKKNDTGSFMFVYNSNTNNFNHGEFDKFMNDVSFAASKYLRNGSTPVRYIMVESTKLDMKEHEELISRYRMDLHKTGVMLVHHVEDVPSDLAMAFHYYCDEYNPLVNKSAIFFTLNLAKCPQESDELSHHALIEKCLAKKWSSVPLKSIGPLLARVVSVVIDVTSAF